MYMFLSCSIIMRCRNRLICTKAHHNAGNPESSSVYITAGSSGNHDADRFPFLSLQIILTDVSLRNIITYYLNGLLFEIIPVPEG